MATVVLASAFNTDNFWSASDNFISNSGTAYRFESAAGHFIEVTGTGLTDSSGNPTGGTYTQIKVFTDNTFATEIASYSSAAAIDFATYFSSGPATALAGNDTITGSSGNDIINGGGGTDTMNGLGGSDVYRYANGDVVGNDSVNDTGPTGDTDVIELVGNATVLDFSSATVLNVEALRFTDLQSATFDQLQLPGNLAVTGASSGQSIIVKMTSGTFSAGGWSFTNWGTNDVVNIIGRLNGDTITGSSQDDFITGLGGADSINGGEGGDTYQYTSGTEIQGDVINDSGVNGGFDRLFLFADVDFSQASSIANIETIGFDGAHTATFNASQFGTGLISNDFLLNGANGTTQIVTVNGASDFSAIGWSLGLFWEAADTVVINGTDGADTITGSNGTDDINGGLGNDTLQSGLGADTLDGEAGSDVYAYSATGDAIGDTISDTGTGGIDTVRLLGDVSFISVTTLTGIEAFVFTGDQDFEINSFPIFGQDFAITGSNGTAQSFTVHNANNFDISDWRFNSWETSDTITLNGSGVGGTIIGSSQRDTINGLDGEDILIGGRGKDTLTGGSENDIFDFNSPKETAKGANRDLITDFTGVNDLVSPDLDLIDLSTIDARTTKNGNQIFKFIGAQKFHHKAGELQVKYNADTDTAIVSGDRNGDGKADFQIQVFSEAALAKVDFLL